jgi:hypothetical protein
LEKWIQFFSKPFGSATNLTKNQQSMEDYGDASMDAATKTQAFLIALISGFGLSLPLQADEGDAPSNGLANLVSEWLAKTPKFSAQLALHFGSTDSTKSVAEDCQNKFHCGGEVYSDQGIKGKFVLTDEAGIESGSKITKPMKFSQKLQPNPVVSGSPAAEITPVGHRICSGNKCYDVKDEPVAGNHCDEPNEASTHATDAQVDSPDLDADDEPIMVVPIAPPAPAPVHVAIKDPALARPTIIQPVLSQPALVQSSVNGLDLRNANVSVPLATVIELLVAKTELSTRLEMTEMVMIERQAASQRYQEMADRMAQMSTQLAVAETRQQLSDTLTASVVDRADLALRIASVDTGSNRASDSNRTVHSIQEDLSNIRRQIALLRRTQPVAFAPSHLGGNPRPYIPTAQLPMSYVPAELVKTTEPALHPQQDGVECGSEATSIEK